MTHTALGDGRREVWRCVGPRWKVDSWPFDCYWPDFLLCCYCVLPPSFKSRVSNTNNCERKNGDDGLDSSGPLSGERSDDGGKKTDKKKLRPYDVCARKLPLSLLSDL